MAVAVNLSSAFLIISFPIIDLAFQALVTGILGKLKATTAFAPKCESLFYFHHCVFEFVNCVGIDKLFPDYIGGLGDDADDH